MRIVVNGFGSSAHGLPVEAREDNMKKSKYAVRERDMLKEYDFSKGIRGKYARRYAKGSNVVVLEPDVARVFRDSRTVNRILRAVAEVSGRKPRRASR